MEEEKDIKKVEKPKKIEFIDDAGNRRMIYTADKITEEYIKKTYSSVKIQELTQENFCDII